MVNNEARDSCLVHGVGVDIVYQHRQEGLGRRKVQS